MYFGRGKNRIQDPYTEIHMYEAYISEIEEDSPYYVSREMFKKVLKLYFNMVMDYILEKSREYTLPLRFGYLSIRKFKPSLRWRDAYPVDFKLTNEAGKRVINLNDHSSGFKYKFHWCKITGKVVNCPTYTLQMSRANKRRLAKLIKSGQDYLDLK